MNAPKYTRDQKRRAVQEIVKRLTEFEGALKLIRQFDICEEDILEYTAARYVNGLKYTIGPDPALTNSPAYDPYTGQPIGAWAVEARAKPRPGSTFDQAVEEAEELRTRAMQAAMSRHLQGLVTAPPPNLKSYTDWA